MRCLFLLIACLFMVLPSCGYGGSGGGSPDCRAYCQKEQECCEFDGDCYGWDMGRMEECLCTCGNMYRSASLEFLQGMKECNNVACEAHDSCMMSLVYSCAGELSPGMEALCNRREECEPGSYAECVQIYSQAVGCYAPKVHTAMQTCSTVGTCETFEDAFEICLMNKLGLVECYPEDY